MIALGVTGCGKDDTYLPIENIELNNSLFCRSDDFIECIAMK